VRALIIALWQAGLSTREIAQRADLLPIEVMALVYPDVLYADLPSFVEADSYLTALVPAETISQTTGIDVAVVLSMARLHQILLPEVWFGAELVNPKLH
jgi:hypothetical protein